MIRFYGIFLICIFAIGCRSLLTQHTRSLLVQHTFTDEHTYIRIDAPVTVTHTSDGTVYALPKREFVQKIRILGEGAVSNIEIWARDSKSDWKPLKVIHRKSASPLILPIEIFMHRHHLPLTFKTDAIRIVERIYHAEVPNGKIDTVEFYTTVSKNQ